MDIKEKQNYTIFTDIYASGKLIKTSSVLEIQSVYVHREFRRKGFGTYLIRAMLRYIESKHLDAKKVVVDPIPYDNEDKLRVEKIIGFFKKLGFTLVADPPKNSPYQMELNL